MHQFSLKALESLQEELKRLPKQHSQDYQLRIVFNFYQYSLKYCLNAQMKQDLITKMSECTGVDMVQLIQEQETTYLGGSLFQEEDKNNTKSSKSDGIKDAKIPNLQEIDEQNRLIKEFEKEKYGETNKARREMLAGVQDEDEFDEEEVESGDKKDKGQRNVQQQNIKKLYNIIRVFWQINNRKKNQHQYGLQNDVLSQELREEMLKISKEQQTNQQSQTVDQ